jgi:HPt (histidine-containing phosphotransfer) domain-containing protein
MANHGSGGFCESLLARVGGDAEVFDQLCGIFLDDAPRRLDAIRAAIDTADGAAVRTAAHTFRGAAAVFDAVDVLAAARRLEQIGAAGDLAGARLAYAELEGLSRVLLDEIHAHRSVAAWKS